MRVANTPPGAERLSLGLRLAALAALALWLMACGRATSNPHSDVPGNDGGSEGFSGHGAGEAGGGESAGGVGGAASSGGSPTVGMGGSGVPGEVGGSSPLANLPLPAGCQARQGAATALLCSLDIACGAVAQSMHCYHTSSTWQCTCEPPNTNRTYMIEGAEGLDACAVGAALCAGPAPAVGGCVPTREEVGPADRPGSADLQTCTVELQCQTPVAVDFAPGVHVTMPGAGVVDCVETLSANRQTEEMRVDCDATGSLGTQSYAVIAKGMPCQAVADFYLSSQAPKFDGSKSCVREAPDLGTSDSCILTETCFDSAPIAKGVSVVKAPLERSANCGFDDLGNLSCGCRFESAPVDSAAPHADTLSFALGPAARPARCDLSACTPEMKAEPTGAAACQAQQDTGAHDDSSCSDSFFCFQPATLQERAVTIYQQLNVRCAEANDRAFYCACAAGDETATFRAGMLQSSVDACALARTDCLAHMTLPVGPSYVSTPPDPLLGL